MRGADEVDAAERFFREAAEFPGLVLVEEEDGFSVVEQLVRGDEPGEPRAGDDDVRLQEVLGHRSSSDLRISRPCDRLESARVFERATGRKGDPACARALRLLCAR